MNSKRERIELALRAWADTAFEATAPQSFLLHEAADALAVEPPALIVTAAPPTHFLGQPITAWTAAVADCEKRTGKVGAAAVAEIVNRYAGLLESRSLSVLNVEEFARDLDRLSRAAPGPFYVPALGTIEALAAKHAAVVEVKPPPKPRVKLPEMIYDKERRTLTVNATELRASLREQGVEVDE